jgi:hypothetical protein
MKTESKPRPKPLRTNFQLVAIDETHNYTDDKLVEACGKIFTVYFFDANEKTHLAELVPSYYLIPLYSYAENDISDEIKDELDACKVYDEPMYLHVSHVDSMTLVKAPKNLNGIYYSVQNKKHKELLETAEEYLNSNHQI